MSRALALRWAFAADLETDRGRPSLRLPPAPTSTQSSLVIKGAVGGCLVVVIFELL